MNRPLREIDAEEATPAAARPQPQVFVRALITPPGPPWEQARAARLDAQHGAPLPIADLLHQVRRLDRWGPGRPGRYAAFYVRAREIRDPFETAVEVDGQSVTVRFGASGPDLRRLRSAGLAVALFMASGALLGGGTMLALGARSEAAAQLEADEQLAATRTRAADAFRARSYQARELRALVGQARPVGDVLGDVAWVASSRTPDARIAAIHWERGLLAVEARGDQPPFLSADRPLERSPRPLRPGVWLWAIGPAGALSQPISKPEAAP